MSHKVTVFSTVCPHPQSLSKFTVVFPEMPTLSMFVSAADLPQETYQESEIWVGGQPVVLPVKTQVPGVWNCTLDESMLSTSKIQLQLLLATHVLSIGNNIAVNPVDILVMLTDESTGLIPLHTVMLKDAWLQTRDTVRLDWSKATEPLKWSLKFRYTECKVVY